MLAADTVTGTSPVDMTESQDEDRLVHVFCPHRQLTWCGDDAHKHQTVATDGLTLDDVCRVCLLAWEMLIPAEKCPICGCTSCQSA